MNDASSSAYGATATLVSLGGARTAANHRVLVLDGPDLSIDATSSLDLTDNDLLVDYDAPADPTADFTALAEQTSGQDLDHFFHVWLFEEGRPTSW